MQGGKEATFPLIEVVYTINDNIETVAVYTWDAFHVASSGKD